MPAPKLRSHLSRPSKVFSREPVGWIQHHRPGFDSYDSRRDRSGSGATRCAWESSQGAALFCWWLSKLNPFCFRLNVHTGASALLVGTNSTRTAHLWDLEHHLTQRRKEIDRKYDFRASRLTDVLGRLLYENRLGEEDLRGLREEKMKSIRSFTQFLRDGAA
jgi:hypothetical protein